MRFDKQLAHALAKSICDIYDATPEEILTKGRRQEVSYARFVIYEFLRTNTDWTLQRISKSFIDSVHWSSVIYGIEKVASMCETSRDSRLTRNLAMKRMKKAYLSVMEAEDSYYLDN